MAKPGLAFPGGLGQLARSMKNKPLGCLLIVVFILLVLSVILNLTFISRSGRINASLSDDLPKFSEETVDPGTSSSKIVRIDLRGLISGTIAGSLGETMVDDLKLALRQATRDDDVKAIVLNIDSPGGEVTASDAIYHAVIEARRNKPVVVNMGSLTASGGYYIACGGSYLQAHETTLTGSIGVIIQTLNYRELFGKIGLDAVVFKSGEFKDILSGAREMRPEEKALIQGLVMGMYDKFVGIVARERKIDEATLRDGIADGRIFSGREALNVKLVDGLGYLEDAYARARELGGAPEASVVRYKAPFKLGKLFNIFGESRTSKLQIELPSPLVPRLESGRIYLLPAFYAP